MLPSDYYSQRRESEFFYYDDDEDMSRRSSGNNNLRHNSSSGNIVNNNNLNAEEMREMYEEILPEYVVDVKLTAQASVEEDAFREIPVSIKLVTSGNIWSQSLSSLKDSPFFSHSGKNSLSLSPTSPAPNNVSPYATMHR